MEAAAAMAAFFFVLRRGGWHGEQLAHNNLLYLQATTACLSAIVITQIVNVFLCRSSSQSVLKINPFENQLILFGIAVEMAVILFIDYTPAGNALFGTAPIPLAAWLSMFPLALAMLVLKELRKWLVHKKCATIPNHRTEHLGKMAQTSK